MENEQHPGFPPYDSVEEMRGLEGAIDSTRARIEEYKASGGDTTELEIHLKSLEERWMAANEKHQRAA